ncbi:MAG: hypothetical protein AB8I08_35880 [Sandaracinaceae bacterium]
MFFLVALAAFGCDPEPMEDAGLDASVDAGRDANLPDAPPPMCEPGCAANEACCEGFVADDTCHNLRVDVSHCGSCNIDCITTNRGDDCNNSSCVCGNEELGCLGTRASFCCPPRTPGGQRYCANLDTNPTDCGDCGLPCNQRRSDRCDGGRCQCGNQREQCTGADDSVCCADGADIGCVDTLTSRIHCGACNNACIGSERCENGSCVRGEDACTDRCEAGEVCCDGACCTRRRCVAGSCAPEEDGGIGDGGVDDGGMGDAGPMSDAGMGDAGADAGASDAGPDSGTVDAGPDAGLDSGV